MMMPMRAMAPSPLVAEAGPPAQMKKRAGSRLRRMADRVKEVFSPEPPPPAAAPSPQYDGLEVDDFVAPRFVRKMKSRQVTDQTTLLFVASCVACARDEKHACTCLYVRPNKLY